VRALGELEVEGVPTTRELALEILRSDAFASGDYSTSFLEEEAARRRLDGTEQRAELAALPPSERI